MKRGSSVAKSGGRSVGAYFLQSLWALIFTVAMLAALQTAISTPIVVALGASVFIVFAMPKHECADPKNIMLSYILGIACGLAGHFIFLEGHLGTFLSGWQAATWLACGVAVGLAVLVMSTVKANHPPAAATALGTALIGFDLRNILFILAFALTLSLVALWLRPRLVNLF
jgi:CBS-domain-containing membrane protein